MPAQDNLFDGKDRLQAPIKFLRLIEIIRRAPWLLERVRSAQAMPWSERDARMWQIVFPNMANWLPEDEASAAPLDFEFAHERERLKAA